MEAAAEVASNLRPEDRSEIVDGYGEDPMEMLLDSVWEPTTVYFEMPNGKAAGMGGVYEDGEIWMVCTPAIYDYPVTFVREAKRYLDSRPEPFIHNIVDKDNAVHIRLLRFLGFKFLQEFRFGPNNKTFIEFCKING